MYAGVLAEQAATMMAQMASSATYDAASIAAYNAMADSASATAGMASTAIDAIPYINLAYSLTNAEENPWGAVAAACACFPPWGTVVAAVINMLVMMFPEDIDPSIGEASVNIDASGAVVVNTTQDDEGGGSTQDDEGGGSTAAQWAERLGELALHAGMSAPQAGAPAQHLPSVGYYYDPDGFNFENSAGQLVLRWTEEDGTQRQRIYDSSGMAWDGYSVDGQSDIARDYLALCQSMEPRWPPVMYEEVYGGILQRDYGVATVLYATALGSYDGQVAHSHGGDADTDGGLVAIEVGSDRLYSFTDNTVESTSLQTAHTLTDDEIQSVPAEIGANPNGPQIPRGRDPIVFVPVGALTGQPSLTVTAGMLHSTKRVKPHTEYCQG